MGEKITEFEKWKKIRDTPDLSKMGEEDEMGLSVAKPDKVRLEQLSDTGVPSHEDGKGPRLEIQQEEKLANEAENMSLEQLSHPVKSDTPKIGTVEETENQRLQHPSRPGDRDTPTASQDDKMGLSL